MYKYLFALTTGIAIGYGYGWHDAQEHDKAVAERVIERIGTVVRERMSNAVGSQSGTGGK